MSGPALWDKGIRPHPEVERFTIGEDRVLDASLWPFDIQASKAHARMLSEVGLLSEQECQALLTGLDELAALPGEAVLALLSDAEDCHTAIENYLTEKLGEAGKKIHTARSRNDQVLTALRLFEKDRLQKLQEEQKTLLQAFNRAIVRFGAISLPGYTHMRKAMPTTVAQWIGSYRDAILDNAGLLGSVFDLVDQCPLGTAAGYGVPLLPVDRQSTAEKLGFKKVQENPIYAQLSRGKFEACLLDLCSMLLLDVNRLASDLLLFQMSEFGFVKLPPAFCSGSSIMPQKQNPDVLELLRAQYHVVVGHSATVKGLAGNLILGYNRDMQLTKGPLIRGMEATWDALRILNLVLEHLEVDEARCEAALTEECYATQSAYALVLQGMPFREAYRVVAQEISQRK